MLKNADTETADQLSGKLLLNIHNKEGILETISDAFHGSLVTGMTFLEPWIDYRDDPISGDIKVDLGAYNSFLVDPYFRKADMSDCNGMWKRTFVTKREAISLNPDKAEMIMGLEGNPYGAGRDGKFQFAPESYNFSINNLLSYDQYWYRDFRIQKLMVDRDTGETQEWKGKDADRLKLFLKLNKSIQVIEQANTHNQSGYSRAGASDISWPKYLRYRSISAGSCFSRTTSQ